MLDGEETVEIACRKLRREGARQHAGQTRYSMLDGEETVQIAWGELCWEGARQHSSRRNGLGKAECRAVGAANLSCWHGFFRTNFIIAIVLKKCGPKTGQTVPRLLTRFPKAEKWDMNGKMFVAAGGFYFHGRRVYTQHLLHKESFTQESFYTQKLLHREALTPRSLYTGEPLHTDAFTQRSLYTEELLHAEAFYTKKRLHTEACTQKSLYTEKSFTQKKVYAKKLLHREVF